VMSIRVRGVATNAKYNLRCRRGERGSACNGRTTIGAKS
jgi:hypothetical protein